METTSFYTFTGLPGRSNKMLISCPVKPTQTVVFFQGDVQVGAKMVDFNYRLIINNHVVIKTM